MCEIHLFKYKLIFLNFLIKKIYDIIMTFMYSFFIIDIIINF